MKLHRAHKQDANIELEVPIRSEGDLLACFNSLLERYHSKQLLSSSSRVSRKNAREVLISIQDAKADPRTWITAQFVLWEPVNLGGHKRRVPLLSWCKGYYAYERYRQFQSELLGRYRREATIATTSSDPKLLGRVLRAIDQGVAYLDRGGQAEIDYIEAVFRDSVYLVPALAASDFRWLVRKAKIDDLLNSDKGQRIAEMLTDDSDALDAVNERIRQAAKKAGKYAWSFGK